MTMTCYSLRGRKLKSEINIIPLLDILLVLLLITIATAFSTSQRIEVNLPNTFRSRFENISEDQTVIIEVSKEGQYNMVVGNDRINRLSSEKIASEIQYRIQSNPKTIFLIGGDKNVPYYKIIKILNFLYSKNIKSVSLMTQPI